MHDLSYSLYFVDSPLNEKGYVKPKILFVQRDSLKRNIIEIEESVAR